MSKIIYTNSDGTVSVIHPTGNVNDAVKGSDQHEPTHEALEYDHGPNHFGSFANARPK